MGKTLTAIIATVIGGLIIIILNFALTKSDIAVGEVKELSVTVYKNKEDVAVLKNIAKNTDERLRKIDRNVEKLLNR